MQKILVIRNDKIGDFMLAWPSFSMLKASMPECHITALVPIYTKALAGLCPWIDDVIVDPGEKACAADKKAVVQEMKAARFDASINLFSTSHSALLVWKAGIPYRLAPATKLAQIFYTRRLRQKRSQSQKPEYQYNMDLIREFLKDTDIPIVEPTTPYLSFSEDQRRHQRDALSAQLCIGLEKPWFFVHAGSGGSANNLSLEQYASIVCGFNHGCEVVLTAGPGEEAMAYELCALVKAGGGASVVYDTNGGLADFACSLACADLFMAGSTGPLHIAAAADVPTIGFFPLRRSATPLRWRPLNSEGRHLAFSPPAGGGKEAEMDMGLVNVVEVLAEVNPWAAQFVS